MEKFELDKKDVLTIKKELKERFPEVKYPSYVAEYILFVILGGLNLAEVAKMVGKDRRTIEARIDNNIKLYIEEQKNYKINQIHLKMYSFLDKAIQVYEDLLENSKNDAFRLKAAKTVLKKFGIVEDKTQLEHSGAIKLPIVNIVGTKSE